MLTYPKSTMRVRRIPMHLSSGHVTFMPGKFYPPSPNFHQSDLGRRADSRWALPQISSCFEDAIHVQLLASINLVSQRGCALPFESAYLYDKLRIRQKQTVSSDNAAKFELIDNCTVVRVS